MKYLLGIFVFVFFSSCEFINFQKQKDASLQPISSVYNVKLFHTDIANFFPSNITKKDSLIFEEKDDTFTCGISLTSDEKFFIISTSDHINTEKYFFSSN